MAPWMALAWLWLLATVISLVSGVTMALVCWGVGASLSEVRFHVGPPLLSFRIRGVKWSFGFLNLGASVTFEPLGIRRDGSDNNSFLQLPLILRLIVHTSTVAGMLLLAVACLSPARGLAEFTSGFEQVLNVLLARERVVAFFALLRTEGFVPALGMLSAKLAALNLLPLPPLTGYLMLRELWRGIFTPRTRSDAVPAWGTLLVLMLLLGWGYGLYEGLVSPHSREPGLGVMFREAKRLIGSAAEP
jgi:peptidase M50-like protein